MYKINIIELVVPGTLANDLQYIYSIPVVKQLSNRLREDIQSMINKFNVRFILIATDSSN
jgi:hypothetical protein